jgi:adenosine deaminase
MLTPELDSFIKRMPKVELHLHLEGSVAPRTLLELARRNGVEIPARDVAGVEQLFNYGDFGEFLTVYMALARAIIYGEDFEQLAYELGVSLAEQNIVYAEVMLSPMQHVLRGVDMHEAIAGAAAGFARVERELGVVTRMALDYGRQYGIERAWPVLETAMQTMHYGVVAWSIGGNEIGHPPEPFVDVFARARSAGLHLMAHAGEVVGPQSVWGAVDVLQVERLGHGIRSIDDPALLSHLHRRRVALDVCPSSNLCTGAALSWEQHPLRRLYDSGVLVTINTDDPTFFQTTLIEEYRRIVRYFGFTVDDICTLVLNGVRASFLNEDARRTLFQRVESDLHRLRAELGV